METLSLWYNFELEFEDEILKQLRFGGKFKRYDDLNYLLRRFEQTGHVKFIKDKQQVTVKSQ